jgi:hypothetical protein
MNHQITTHPNVPATGAASPKNPNNKFRIRPGGEVIPMIATAFCITKAAHPTESPGNGE